MWGTEFQHDTYFGHFSLNKMEFSCIFVDNRVVKLRCRIVGIFFVMMWCQRQIRKFFKGGGWKTMYQPRRLLSQMHTMNYTRILQGNIVTYWKHAEVSRGGRPLLPWIRHCFHYYSVFCYCQTVGSFSVNNEISFFVFLQKTGKLSASCSVSVDTSWNHFCSDTSMLLDLMRLAVRKF